MKSPYLLLIILRLVILSVAFSGITLAFAREISLQEAIERAQQQAKGKVLSAETVQMSNGKTYRIKILTQDGQVSVIQISAEE